MFGIQIHEDGKYLASIMDNSATICDENIDAARTLSPTTREILIKRMQPAKRNISMFYLNFY